MPTRDELIAHGRTTEEVCREITADGLVRDGDGPLGFVSDELMGDVAVHFVGPGEVEVARRLHVPVERHGQPQRPVHRVVPGPGAVLPEVVGDQAPAQGGQEGLQ